jgi:hypothetical protein
MQRMPRQLGNSGNVGVRIGGKRRTQLSPVQLHLLRRRGVAATAETGALVPHAGSAASGGGARAAALQRAAVTVEGGAGGADVTTVWQQRRRWRLLLKQRTKKT